MDKGYLKRALALARRSCCTSGINAVEHFTKMARRRESMRTEATNVDDIQTRLPVALSVSSSSSMVGWLRSELTRTPMWPRASTRVEMRS
jgi:hypothetical protein